MPSRDSSNGPRQSERWSSRRCFLQIGVSTLVASVAGCTGLGSSNGALGVAEAPTARLEMIGLADAALPPKVLYSVGVEDGPDRRARLFERILDGGTTVQGTRPPLPEEQHIFYDDAVYQLSHDVVEQTPATRYSVKVDIVEGSVTDAEAIQFAELPEVDREEFDEHGLADGDPIGIGTTFLYTDAEREQSVLVPDSEYSFIVWENGAQAEWVVDDAYDTTLNTYEYTATQVDTAAEYGRRMRERFAFALSNLSDAQRDIVETAISEEQYVVGPDETPPSPLVALTDQFRDHEQAHGLDEAGESDLSGTYLVRYDGKVYWTTLVVHGDAFPTETPD